MENSNKLLTIDEVCKKLLIGKTTGYKLLKGHVIPSCRIGKRILVREEDVNNYIEKIIKSEQ